MVHQCNKKILTNLPKYCMIDLTNSAHKFKAMLYLYLTFVTTYVNVPLKCLEKLIWQVCSWLDISSDFSTCVSYLSVGQTMMYVLYSNAAFSAEEHVLVGLKVTEGAIYVIKIQDKIWNFQMSFNVLFSKRALPQAEFFCFCVQIYSRMHADLSFAWNQICMRALLPNLPIIEYACVHYHRCIIISHC